MVTQDKDIGVFITTQREKLLQDLALKDPGFIGCRRRGKWSSQSSTWRFMRGNALLAQLGSKTQLETPAGPFEYYTLADHLLQFRGGPFSPHWLEDFYDAWAVAQYWNSNEELSRHIILVHEDRGNMQLEVHSVPESIDAAVRAAKILTELQADPPGRISKATAYAIKVCRFCPVRIRCNTQDKFEGNMVDWSTAFRRTLP